MIASKTCSTRGGEKMRIYRFAFILHDPVWEHIAVYGSSEGISKLYACRHNDIPVFTSNAFANERTMLVYTVSQSSSHWPQYQCGALFKRGWQPQRSAALIMAGCLNANTENDIPCQQCTSDTSLSLQIPPFCPRALFSTLVSRQWERFPLLVSIKRVNSLHLSTYHLRAPAWRADDLSVLPDTVWETVISLIRDRARAIISDMILTIWNPHPQRSLTGLSHQAPSSVSSSLREKPGLREHFTQAAIYSQSERFGGRAIKSLLMQGSHIDESPKPVNVPP